MAEFTSILNVVFLVFVLPTIIRMFWHGHQRRIGTWNPENFQKWVWWDWRWFVQKLWVSFGEWKGDNIHAGTKATGGWGGLAGRLVAMFKPGDVLLGGFGYYGIRLFQPLGVKGERHLAMVAGTGSGKTTFLITMLGLHRGNAFVIDPKAQITKVIARRRGQGTDSVEGMGKDVHVLDPNGIAKGHQSAHWNALDELAVVEKQHGRSAVGRFARKIAAALVLHVKGEKPYFPKSARAIVRAIILYVYAVEPPEKRSMLRVRQLLTQGLMQEMIDNNGASHEEAAEKGFDCLLVEMTQVQDVDFGEAIRNGAKTILDAGRSRGDVLSTAREALDFFDLAEIADLSTRSDFSLLDLKTGNTDLFVCAPTGDIRETYSGWFRLLTSMAIDLFEQNEHTMKHKTLFAVDEMPSIGYIQPIAESAAVMRSYGVQLLAITVDLGLLKRTYPDEWGTFLGGADAVYWMASKHQETLDYLAKDLGEATITTKDRPWWKAWMIWRRWYKSTHTQAVMTPEQLAKVLAPHKENMITTRYGKRPLLVKTMPYYKELPVAFYEPDPDHKETPERAATRRRLQARAEEAHIQEPEPIIAPQPTPPMPEPVREPVAKNVVPLHEAPQATVKLTIVEASALFGVSGMYTLDDLEARKNQLLENSELPDSYRRFVEHAYDMLAKPLKFEKARVGG